MSFINKFKRHPPIMADDYYAEFSGGELDPEDAKLQYALDQTNNLRETWPYISLADLNTFVNAIQQNIVIPSGRDFSLGEVSYVRNDPETKQPTDTGLTWQPAVIKADTGNFVVETVSTTLNNEETQQDDSVTYPELESVFQQLFEAAIEYGGLDQQDLPELPSQDEFDDAVENETHLKIESKRFIQKKPENKPINQESVKPKAIQNTDTAIIFPKDVDADSDDVKASRYNRFNTGQLPAVFNDTNSQSSRAEGNAPHSPSEAPIKPLRNEKQVSETPSNSSQEKLEGSSKKSDRQGQLKTRSKRIYGSDPLSVIENFSLDVPQFDVDSALLQKTLEPGQTGYTASAVTKERFEANQALKGIAETYIAEVKQKTLAAIDSSSLDAKIATLLTSNWQDRLKDKVANEVRKEFAEKQKRSIQTRKEKYKADLESENLRHKQIIKQLQDDLDSEIDQLNQQNKLDVQNAITVRQTNEISGQQLYIDKTINELRETENQRISQTVAKYLNGARKSVNKSLSDAYNTLSQQLKEVEAKAEEKQRDAIEQLIEQQKKQVESTDIDQLKQLADSQTERANKLAAEASASHAKLVTAQEAAERLTAQKNEMADQLSKLQGNLEQMKATQSQLSTDELLKTYLASQMTNPNGQETIQKKHHYGTIAGVLGTLLVAGAVGTSGYYWSQQQHKDYVAAAQSREASLKSSVAKDKSASSKADAKGSKKEVSKQKASTATSTVSTDNQFKNLDADVNSNHSLAVYNQFFKNQNLETDARVWAVGKLLMNAGLYEDAWALANANTGHNQTLVSALQGGQ